ncbi:MAG: hypothetical protein ACT4OS_08720 [Acidimicrobiales bacterium]
MRDRESLTSGTGRGSSPIQGALPSIAGGAPDLLRLADADGSGGSADNETDFERLKAASARQESPLMAGK